MTDYEQFICDEFLKIVSNGNSGCSVKELYRGTYKFTPDEVPTVTVEMSICQKKETDESSDPILALAYKLCDLNEENKAFRDSSKRVSDEIKALKNEKKIAEEKAETQNADIMTLKHDKKIADRTIDELHAEILRYISLLDEANKKIKKLSNVEKENENLKKWNEFYKEVIIKRSDMFLVSADSELNPTIHIQIDGVDIHVTNKNFKKGEKENG